MKNDGRTGWVGRMKGFVDSFSVYLPQFSSAFVKIEEVWKTYLVERQLKQHRELHQSIDNSVRGRFVDKVGTRFASSLDSPPLHSSIHRLTDQGLPRS